MFLEKDLRAIGAKTVHIQPAKQALVTWRHGRIRQRSVLTSLLRLLQKELFR